MKWLNRRSQKKSFNLKTFSRYMERYPLPKPKIHHNFYDLKAVFVNATEEPFWKNHKYGSVRGIEEPS